MAPRIPPCRSRHFRRHAPPQRLPERGPRRANLMSTLTIHNPATGQVLAEVPADDAASVAAKAARSRQAQPAWAATPLAQRILCLQRFRAAIELQVDRLAMTLT